MMKRLLVLLSTTALVAAIPPPHPRVLAVRHEEGSLPDHLRSPALRNPHLRHVLPITSLLHHGEQPVYERQSDHVPRGKIYDMLTHAGLTARRPQPSRIHPAFVEEHEAIFHDPPLFQPDLLQHL